MVSGEIAKMVINKMMEVYVLGSVAVIFNLVKLLKFQRVCCQRFTTATNI